jgi:hypothetical protein
VKVQFRVEIEVLLLPLRASPEGLHWYGMVFRRVLFGWCSWQRRKPDGKRPCQPLRSGVKTTQPHHPPGSKIKHTEHISGINILPPSTSGYP